MESFLISNKTTKSYLESIATCAYSSRANYKSVVNRLEEFSNQRYGGRTAQDVINELKSIPIEQRDESVNGARYGFDFLGCNRILTSTASDMAELTTCLINEMEFGYLPSSNKTKTCLLSCTRNLFARQ